MKFIYQKFDGNNRVACDIQNKCDKNRNKYAFVEN